MPKCTNWIDNFLFLGAKRGSNNALSLICTCGILVKISFTHKDYIQNFIKWPCIKCCNMSSVLILAENCAQQNFKGLISVTKI